MRTLAILPVKSFALAKQRLAGGADAGERRTLAGAMLADVLDSLAQVTAIDEVAVVTADPAAALEASGRGARVIRDEKEAGQSAAAALGIAYALEAGFERALLVPGDTPLLDARELDELLEDERTAVTIVPDRHGTGTNALVLSPPGAIEPGFGPGSLERHAQRAAALDHRVAELPSLALDLDTPEDLAALESALATPGGGAERTRAALAARRDAVGA